MLGGMNPNRAATAVDELLAIAKAVQSNTLEADTKAFVAAAKKAEKAKGDLSAAEAALKKRETAAEKKETSNDRAAKKLKGEREAFREEQKRHDVQMATEKDDLTVARTRLNVDAAAIKSRDQQAQDTMAQARTMMDAARELDKAAKAMKTNYEGKLARLKAAVG